MTAATNLDGGTKCCQQKLWEFIFHNSAISMHSSTMPKQDSRRHRSSSITTHRALIRQIGPISKPPHGKVTTVTPNAPNTPPLPHSFSTRHKKKRVIPEGPSARRQRSLPLDNPPALAEQLQPLRQGPHRTLSAGDTAPAAPGPAPATSSAAAAPHRQAPFPSRCTCSAARRCNPSP